jgi:hypothetical protein
MMQIAHGAPLAQRHALDHVGQIVRDQARDFMGTYDARPRWPELADATKEDRAHKGFTENDPLLRTGETRDSIGYVASPHDVQIGSNSDKLVWNALGTSRIPARDPFVPAVLARRHEIEHVIGHTMHAYLSSGTFHQVIR